MERPIYESKIDELKQGLVTFNHQYNPIFFISNIASALPIASSTGWCVCLVFRKCLKFFLVVFTKPLYKEPKLVELKPNGLQPPRKVERPPLEILEKEVLENGYCATGRKYGVSDNCIRKWIKSYKYRMSDLH